MNNEYQKNNQVRTVIIVEDQKHTSDRLREAIDSARSLKVIGNCQTMSLALSMLANYRPDFVLTDIGLPDGSGIEVIRAAAAADWPCESMVFTVFGDERNVLSAIRAGAKGYILKTSHAKDIVKEIEIVLEGGAPISPQIAHYLLTIVRGDTATQEGKDLLTEREREVLGLIAKGYKRGEIASQMAITVGTVGNHIHNIYRKLNASSNTEAVFIAGKSGIL